MEEGCRAGEGQLMALGGLAKVCGPFSISLSIPSPEQLQIFSSPLSLPPSHISTILALLLGHCLKLCCPGQTLVPKESHLCLQPPALHFGDRGAQHLFRWASSCKPLEHLS